MACAARVTKHKRQLARVPGVYRVLTVAYVYAVRVSLFKALEFMLKIIAYQDGLVVVVYEYVVQYLKFFVM